MSSKSIIIFLAVFMSSYLVGCKPKGSSELSGGAQCNPITIESPLESDHGFDHIYTYTHDDYYGPINKALRTKDELSLLQYSSIIRGLQAELNMLIKFEGVVYRGAGDLPDNITSRLKEGNIIEFGGFVSTTKNPNIAFSFAKKYLFVINSKSGRSISNWSSYNNEDEVLFKYNKKFKVDEIFKGDDAITYVKMTEVVKKTFAEKVIELFNPFGHRQVSAGLQLLPN